MMAFWLTRLKELAVVISLEGHLDWTAKYLED